MNTIVWVILVLIDCVIAFKSTTGKEFVTGFLWLPYVTTTLKLDIASNTSGDILVSVPYLGIHTHSSFNRSYSLTLNNSLGLRDSAVGNRGVYIRSSVDISVYATTYVINDIGADTHLGLPVGSLGTLYQIVSYQTNYYEYPSLFLVIAPFDNTVINVSFPNGTSASKTLNALDVYQEASLTIDLTGTIVQSSKPVAVVSGNSCSRMINSEQDCDLIGEQLIPIDSYETKFIVPPIYQSKQFVVRILSSKNNSETCVKDAFTKNCTTLEYNTWIETQPKRTPLVITSNGPITVMQYKESQAYMTTIPGISQYMNSYSFAVPRTYVNTDNFVAVIIETNAIHNLRLDDNSPNDKLVDTAGVPAPFSSFSILTYRVTVGHHEMSITPENVVFGLIAFGYNPADSGSGSNGPAYGYPVGMHFQTNEQLMCYSCDDMSDLELCDTVQRCAPRELCIVKYSHSKYSSGCANSSVCASAQTAHGHCSECCDENYCNGRGCGDTGLASRSGRGPICFDCNHVLRIDQCKTVRPCYKDEVCSIEEFDWLGHFNYKLGCVAAACTSIDHGRSVPRCKSCCSEDFCNTNCTVRETAAIIG